MDSPQAESPDTHLVDITKIQIVPRKGEKGFVGFASCVVNDLFYVDDIALFTRLDGTLRLGWPIKKLPDGRSIPLFRPLCPQVAREFEVTLTHQYWGLMDNNGFSKDASREYPADASTTK